MVDIRQMRYFVALAETLHFGRAAARLNISQPPLSRQIAALERDLGARLVERHTRQATLTHAGRRFLEDARAALGAFDLACRNARLADRGDIGELSIGFMMHAAYTVVPNLARRHMAAHPGVNLVLREVVPSALAEAVLRGQFDAAIMFDPGPIRGLQSLSVYREPLCLAVHRSHPLASRERIGAADLDGAPLIAAPAEVAPMLRAAIAVYCRTGGFEPTIRLETQLQQTIVNLVAEGIGVALVPRSLRKSNLAEVVFRDLDDAPCVENLVVWRAGNLNPALGPFLTEAKALADEAMPEG